MPRPKINPLFFKLIAIVIVISVAALGVMFLLVPSVVSFPGPNATHTNTTTTTSHQYQEVEKVISSSFSSDPISATAYGSNRYFEETDKVQIDHYTDGKLVGTTYVTDTYPVTPAMVAFHPSSYPQYMIDAYKTMYPDIMNNPLSMLSPISITSPSNGVDPNEIISWSYLGL
jgi:hypothetical protein